MATPPENGFNFLLPWGIVEWLITSLFAAVGGVGWWLLQLGWKVDRLEEDAKEERAQMKEEIKKLEDKVERLSDKLEAVREELPSKQFIEGQLNNLGLRIDRAIEAQARGRA